MNSKDREKLEVQFNTGASKIPSEPEHWINGADGGLSYCLDCCKKEVERLLKKEPDGEYTVDGGWGTEGDSTPFCEVCGKLLENTLTDYGCEAEVEHFLSNGFDPESDDDCRAMSEVISARGWELWADMIYRNEDEKQADVDYFKGLYELCARILKLIDPEAN